MALKRRKKGKYNLPILYIFFLNILSLVESLNCYCDPCEGNNSCVLPHRSMCFVSINMIHDRTHPNGIEEWSYGCLPPETSALLQCKTNLVPSVNLQRIICCNQTDYCNKDLEPVYQLDKRSTTTTEDSNVYITIKHDHLTKVALFVSVSCCVILLVVIIVFVYLRYRQRERDRQQLVDEFEVQCAQDLLPPGEKLKDVIDQCHTSGSGSGIPIMVQRTVAKQISLCNIVGKGRYGEVWRGQWRKENVAVKIFYTTDECSWFRETELYQTLLLRHDNILGFIAADIRGTASSTQLWLITDYHKDGSLYDYLKINTVGLNELLVKSLSIAKGLAHLHSEIVGSNGKPSIAHRDMKSKNVLVMSNGECCIADLGYAARYFSETKTIDAPVIVRQGTMRYMAPEVLNETLRTSDFKSYLQADMYSFGLVLWEIANRCVFMSHPDKLIAEYEIPFEHYVDNSPSFDDMREIVCVENCRPQIPDSWYSHETMRLFSKVITECWHASPVVRLTSVRVKKTLTSMLELSCTVVKS